MTKMHLSDFVSHAAFQALCFEANVTPKPGLVDKNNTGAHEDMTLDMLLESAKTIAPYIGHCAVSGFETQGLPYENAFLSLKGIGLQAEKAMKKATGGVNTHKGAIYAFCLLAGAFGRLVDREGASPESLLKTASLLSAQSSVSSLSSAFRAPLTNGDIAFQRACLSGARGEALSGYPSIINIALPSLEKALQKGFTENDAGVYALLNLISKVDDTCLYSRGGLDGLALAKSLASKALEGDFLSNAAKIDSIFNEKRLSPGGCADLLAAAMFIKTITNSKREEYTCE